jgi:hypothetical protein
MSAPKNGKAPDNYGGGNPQQKGGGTFFDQWGSAVGDYVDGAMGKGHAAPDYTGAAEKTAAANRLNTHNAYGGGVTFNPDGSVSQSFGAGMQPAVDRLTQQLANNYAKPMDDGSAARDQAINAMYGQATSRLNPQWDNRGSQLQQQLANQGLDPGSQAYRNAEQSFGQDRNDAYSSAMNSAIGMGNQAQNLTFQQNMAARNEPLMALGQFQQFLGQPGYNPGANYLGAAQLQGDYQMGLDQMRTKAINDQIQGSMQMGSAMSGAAAKGALSDERTKTNIHRLPVDAVPGVPLATFEYKHKPGKHVGVIAQDLEKQHPEHVQEDEHGLKHVSRHFKPFRFK